MVARAVAVTAGVVEGATAGVVEGRAVAEGGATAEEVVEGGATAGEVAGREAMGATGRARLATPPGAAGATRPPLPR